MFKLYYVYILASRSRVLYIGMTGNLANRVAEHRAKLHPGSFTCRYNVDRLVYFEDYTEVSQAFAGKHS